MRTRRRGEAIEVLCVVNHPMETGQRVDGKTSRRIPAHYIQKMVFKLNGQQVAVADTGTGLSRRPLIAVRLKGTKTGDTISV
ncbi:MAG: thiosulfate oxidation carrier complex protein SoxZ, partial [Gammaproteobacteria bacterium]|nr:thiosulfate oxidation carrier complex protein SoxZ [Gammaproteobacteria bacterium]